MKIVKLPGRQWVTCSIGWAVITAVFILFGCLSFALSFGFALRDGFGETPIIMFIIGGLCMLSTMLVITSVSVTATHLRRAPQNGRPTKVPLSEITQIWPVGSVIHSSAGKLIEVKVTPFASGRKNFDHFGPELAELIDAEWLPYEPRQ